VRFELDFAFLNTNPHQAAALNALARERAGALATDCDLRETTAGFCASTILTVIHPPYTPTAPRVRPWRPTTRA
jgi:hypothetical protein